MQKINYYLRENPFSTSDKNLFTAQVKNAITLDQEGLIDAMLGKNTTVTRQDILVVLDLFEEIVKENILSGYAIKTNLFKAKVSIKGGFTSSKDEFDSSRHKVCVNLNGSADFKRDLLNNASVTKVDRSVSAPLVNQVYDYSTRDYGTAFPMGGLILIKGANLKGYDKATRVFLSSVETEEEFEVASIHSESDRSVLCDLPADLTAGSYWLSVVVGEGVDASRGKYSRKIILT
ncbi:MAG: DNA-binding domain-containing protein [Spirochaetales bacterium]|nr:DNA-binding domain-containing protein [Spirochaetales bacterium]